MNLSVLFRKICVVSCVLVVIFTLTNCKSCKKNTDEDEKKQTYYDNENDPIVFSSAEVDKVFNPFFSTSGTDSNVVGFTQIGMLGNDKNGNITYGDNEAVVVKGLEITTTGEKDVDQITEYRFVLKNNVKYSNGSPLTIKDVLFNLYVYLDKAYTGSSTIYSTDIVGLQEYRTQAATEKEQNSFNKKFQLEAEARIQALVSAATEIFDEHKNEDISSIKFIEYLEDCKTISNTYANVVLY